jgi:hypothetical protein
MAAEERKRCAHPVCSFRVTSREYCSPQYEAGENALRRLPLRPFRLRRSSALKTVDAAHPSANASLFIKRLCVRTRKSSFPQRREEAY